MTLLKCMPDHLCSWSFVLFRSVIVYKTIHVISRIVNGCDIVQILSSERELINCNSINWLGQRPLIFSPWIFHPFNKRMRRLTIFWIEAELVWNPGKIPENKDKDWYQTLLCIWNTYIFVKVVSVSHSPSLTRRLVLPNIEGCLKKIAFYQTGGQIIVLPDEMSHSEFGKSHVDKRNGDLDRSLYLVWEQFLQSINVFFSLSKSNSCILHTNLFIFASYS